MGNHSCWESRSSWMAVLYGSRRKRQVDRLVDGGKEDSAAGRGELSRLSLRLLLNNYHIFPPDQGDWLYKKTPCLAYSALNSPPIQLASQLVVCPFSSRPSPYSCPLPLPLPPLPTLLPVLVPPPRSPTLLSVQTHPRHLEAPARRSSSRVSSARRGIRSRRSLTAGVGRTREGSGTILCVGRRGTGLYQQSALDVE